MKGNIHLQGLLHALRHILNHAGVTLLAVGIAISLPYMAQYILFIWWPMVAGDSQLLSINEIGFAVVFVLLLNLFLSAREGRLNHRMNRLISLVHVRENGKRFSRRADRSLIERVAGMRELADSFGMAMTGRFFRYDGREIPW